MGTPRMPAFVQPLSGHEMVKAMQIDARARYNVTVRYPYQELTTQMVVTFHGRDGDQRLEVLDVTNIDERNREVILLCGELA